MSLPRPTGHVRFARRCRLTVTADSWDFATANAEAIDANWAARTAANPRLFNGRIHLMTAYSIDMDGTFSGQFIATDFKSYLLWREQGFADTRVADCFGSALVRSAEGATLLGRQSEGNINAGLSYLPGGFIDARDVTPEGEIDIEASITREIAEEIGLAGADLERVPGFHITFAGPLISIAIEYRSPLSSKDLKANIERHLGSETEPELAGILFVRELDDLVDLPMPDYARVLLAELFSAKKPA